MTKRTKYLGRESGKSSNKFFGKDVHPKGYGASTGNGYDTDSSVVGKIEIEFKNAKGRG